MEKDQRSEGAYLTYESAGLPPYEVKLFTIVRVNGDQSVSKIELTETELRTVVEHAKKMLKEEQRAT